jgi:guanylate kinase
VKLLKNYNLSLALAALFLVSWAVQTGAGWVEFVAEAAEHESEAQVFGPDGYVWSWLKATMENWQSEFLQLLTFVTLTSFLIHRGSPESKDGDERLERKVDEIRRQLEKMGAK